MVGTVPYKFAKFLRDDRLALYSKVSHRLFTCTQTSNATSPMPVAHKMIAAKSQADYVEGLLQHVGLDPAVMRRFPHQFSGGQRAWLGIAPRVGREPRVSGP